MLAWDATNRHGQGKHQGWVPMASAPSFTQDELASDEGCTDPHKRKLRWIAHIFDKGWEIGRIQDEKAPRGHKYASQYQVRPVPIRWKHLVSRTAPCSVRPRWELGVRSAPH